MENRIYHLHALTALHVGVGQGSGIIDLPIARERATHLPVVPGSAVKGVLREELRPNRLEYARWAALFGPERIADNGSGFTGALVIGDARLLCLPVRSLYGTFAFATCPLVLRRYARDWQTVPMADIPTLPEVSAERCRIGTDSVLVERNTRDRKVYLEDLDLLADSGAETWAAFIAGQIFPEEPEWQDLFKARFTILSDTEFDFLAEIAMEVRARVKLQEGTRTVAKGALWYEENLPAESVLWGLLAADRDFSGKASVSAAELLKHLPGKERLQIGGKASVGRGQVRWLLRQENQQ